MKSEFFVLPTTTFRVIYSVLNKPTIISQDFSFNKCFLEDKEKHDLKVRF